MPSILSRRSLMRTAAQATAVVAWSVPSWLRAAEIPASRKFTLHLSIGNLGVKADSLESIRLARKLGFGSVAPQPGELHNAPDGRIAEVTAALRAAGLVWGCGGVGPYFEPDDARFKARLEDITRTARTLQRIGAGACMTWLMPSHESLTYRENFRVHVRRTQEVARLLADHNLRLGLEYVGTRTLSTRSKYPFIRSLPEMRELLAEIDRPNVGLVLDTWHWWQAGDTGDDLLKLKPDQIVLADLCDAPDTAPREQLPDSPRKLPCTTKVIDVRPFVAALIQLGYAGPVGVEPFDKSLGQLSAEQAAARAMESLKRATVPAAAE